MESICSSYSSRRCGTLAAISPQDIENIEILKDASATAVFGVRGANGVVLITTKRGKEGKAKISFTTSSSIIAPTESIKMANSYQYATFYNQINTGDGLNPTFSDEIIQKFKDGSDPGRLLLKRYDPSNTA